MLLVKKLVDHWSYLYILVSEWWWWFVAGDKLVCCEDGDSRRRENEQIDKSLTAVYQGDLVVEYTERIVDTLY